MCGRFVLEATTTELVNAFALDDAPDMPPRYNIAPTQGIMTVRSRPVPEGSNRPPREAVPARWGLIPGWVKDPKDFPLLINARSETAASKASFRNAMKRRRILVPISGFYEWKRTDVGRSKPVLEPFYVRPRRGGIVALAGLMETEVGADAIDTAAIMTTAANDAFARVHHRMPVVINPADFERWLDCDANDPASVADLMRTPPDDYFELVPVSDAVNKVKHQGPELIERVEREAAVAAPKPKPDAAAPPEPVQGSLF